MSNELKKARLLAKLNNRVLLQTTTRSRIYLSHPVEPAERKSEATLSLVITVRIHGELFDT
jgi:hypothetical protein